MDLSLISEEQQIAIAIQRSMQYPEMEETPSSMPIATTADDAIGPPLSLHSDEVFITFLCNPHSFSIFTIFHFLIFA